jgi:hypothetical protein
MTVALTRARRERQMLLVTTDGTVSMDRYF